MTQKIGVLLAMVLLACAPLVAQPLLVNSPNGNIQVSFELAPDGSALYSAAYKGQPVVLKSRLGMLMADGTGFTNQLRIQSSERKQVDETWNPVWGEEKQIRDQHNALRVTLQTNGEKAKTLVVEFRVFNDGFAFRYEWPRQPHLNYFVVKNELTSFALAGDHKTWWIPGDYDTNEFFYTTSKLSEVDASKSAEFTEIGVKVPFSDNGVQTPLMMKSQEGLYINLHEAALVNYPAMQLELDKKTFTLQAHLVPDAVGNAAYLQAPAKSPWRTVLVSNKATDILASRTILNLNEPSVIADPSYIKPTKYIGLWWEMHVGKSTWDYAATQDMFSPDHLSNLKPSGRHGATTQRVKQYLDFAGKHGFDGVLVEGWNIGWEDWYGNWKEDVFDFVTPYPDFDLL